MNPAKKGLGRGLSALFGDIEKKSGHQKLNNQSDLMKNNSRFYT